ncbi:MAG TPA: electron transport complex subunit E [Clostridia bacterium]|nr:electron transport complex subunit E [Clostridia bacterium]
MNWSKYKKIATNGVLKNNPILRLVLGTCPTLALTTSALNAFGMGLAVMFILTISNTIISLLRKIIPDEVRIPAYVMIIATIVTIVRMLLEKYIPVLYESFGVYLPLIVVNCIILGRAEGFASKNVVFDSALDGLSTGLGCTLGMGVLGIIREVFGAGSIFGIQLFDFKIEFFTSPAGAFFVYGIVIAIFNTAYKAIENSIHKKNFSLQLKELSFKEAE